METDCDSPEFQNSRDRNLKRCAVTREYGNRHHMIRFARLPDMPPVPDLASRAGGRGIWLKAERNVIKTALKSRVFSGSGGIKDFQTVLEQLSDLFERRLLDSLGLARRASHVTLGFDKVCAELKDDKPSLLVLATDCSKERCRVIGELVADRRFMRLFDGDRLGYALGRGKTTCVLVNDGHSQRRLDNDIIRYSGLRPELFLPISES